MFAGLNSRFQRFKIFTKLIFFKKLDKIITKKESYIAVTLFAPPAGLEPATL